MEDRAEPKRILVEVRGEKPDGECVIALEDGVYVYRTVEALFQPIMEEEGKLRLRIEKAEEAIRTLSKAVETLGEALKENL